MHTATRQIRMSAPDIQDEDVELVSQVLRSGSLSMGSFVQRFERAFADYIGTSTAVAVSSGTAGLHLCVSAAGIGPGDEVVTTPFSFVASTNCILYERATPVLVDIEWDSMNIDPKLAAAAMTERTRAMIPIHIFGRPSALNALEAVCRAHDIVMFEDACEALGAEFQGRKVGGFGTAGVFGFYPNKQITTGEGGLITTNDMALAAKLRSLRNQGRDEMGTWLFHEHLGFNYRLDEMSAALGLSQLKRVDTLLERRRKAAATYAALLAELDGVTLVSPIDRPARPSWFVLVVRLDERISRDGVVEHLSRHGIPTRAYFPPIHLQPYMKERFGYREGDFPVTERVARTTLALPFHTNIPDTDIEYVVRHLKTAVDRSAA
jgi:perosamine synthetase